MKENKPMRKLLSLRRTMKGEKVGVSGIMAMRASKVEKNRMKMKYNRKG